MSGKIPTPNYGSDLTGPLMFGTIAVVGIGSVIGDKSVNAKAIIAGAVVAVGLSAIDNANEKMAEAFAAIIFLGACFKFLPTIVGKMGFNNGGSGNDINLKDAKPIASTINNTSGSGKIQPVVYKTANVVTPPAPKTATPQQSGGFQI